MKTTNVKNAIRAIIYDIELKMRDQTEDDELVIFLLRRAQSLHKRRTLEQTYNCKHVTLPPQEAIHDTVDEWGAY